MLRGEYEGLAAALTAASELQDPPFYDIANDPTDSKLQSLFKNIDTDGDGKIDFSELKARKVKSVVVRRLLRLADRNRDDQILGFVYNCIANKNDKHCGHQIDEANAAVPKVIVRYDIHDDQQNEQGKNELNLGRFYYSLHDVFGRVVVKQSTDRHQDTGKGQGRNCFSELSCHRRNNAQQGDQNIRKRAGNERHTKAY